MKGCYSFCSPPMSRVEPLTTINEAHALNFESKIASMQMPVGSFYVGSAPVGHIAEESTHEIRRPENGHCPNCDAVWTWLDHCEYCGGYF